MMTDNEFAFEPVPDEHTVSGFRIAVVLTGIIVALPAFIIGAQLGSSLGFRKGALAILLGGLILCAIALATGSVGSRTRLTTAMIARQTFGTGGSKLVSGILAMACLGWFGVTAEIFGQSLHQALLTLGSDFAPRWIYIAGGGLFMTVTTIFGFAALQRLSAVTVPLLGVLIAYTAYLASRQGSGTILLGSGNGEMGLGDGVSAIVGSLAVAVTIFPDLCRFSRRPRDAWFAAFLTYAVAMPAIQMLATIPSIVMRQNDILAIMVSLGLGIPALALLVLKAWATNSGNLYVASLSAANLLSTRRQSLVIAMSGALGTIVAVFGVTERIVPFLVGLGVTIPPVAGLYVADYWIRRNMFDNRHPPFAFNTAAFVCWAFGICVAGAARSGLLVLSGVSAIDSMLAAAISYLIFRRLCPCRDTEADRLPIAAAE